MTTWLKRLAARPVALLVVTAGLVGAAASRWWSFMDLDVYRLGGRTVLDGQLLYAAAEPGSGLLFTYPPFAAMAMTVLAVPPVMVVTGLWTGLGVAAVAVTLAAFGRELGLDLTPRRLAAVTLLLLLVTPVRETLWFGQVNLVVMALVSYDLLVLRGRWSGVLVGIAAGLKLTPLVLVVLLVLIGRRDAALRATSTFFATVLVAVILLPHDTADFWTRAIWHAERVGGLEYIRNQSLLGTMTRLGHGEPAAWVWLPVSAVAGSALLALAALWWRRGARDVGVLLAAGAMLLCSPISWDHHFVWAAPLLLVLARRTPKLVLVAVAALLVVGLRPLVTHGDHRELDWQASQQLVGNGYTWLVLGFAVAAAVALVRASARRLDPAGHLAEREPAA